MAVIIDLHAGVTLANPVTKADLQALVDNGWGTLNGALETEDLGDGIVTAAKLATTQDLSTKTLTLPSKFNPQTSIGSAPGRVGQLAVVSGMTYIATGTSAASDWKPLDTPRIVFNEESSDPTGIAGKVMLYAKDAGSGVVQLFYISETGAATQLTGVVGTAMAAHTAPDWDSGWTAVTKNSLYDLSSATVSGTGPYYGGFSSETKGTSYGATWDIGDANDAMLDVITPAQSFWGFRLIKVLMRRGNDGSSYMDEVCCYGTHMTRSAFAGTEHGWWIFWDNSASKLMLQTAADGAWAGFDPHTNMDWAAVSGDDAQLRIQMWL